MVWLGGITIALGGVFLVKYSIDLGLLSPAVRISLGTLLGIALTVVGEWLRRRPLQRASASVGPDHVPPALTSAGILVSFGSIYAGHVLYGLLSPMAAFGFLAAIAFGALALSILQGALVAIMGIAGAFTIPLLI
ncbi:MAG: DUF2339 domain-containing protein, partial [Rhodospirillales bacterium]|nr:DUF2339 domain-containing protein [Rhodospirillales bacterium]